MTSTVLIGAPTAALVFLLLNAAHAQAPLVLNTPQPTPTTMASGQLPDQLPEWSLYGENLEHRWSSTEHATVYSVEAHYGSDANAAVIKAEGDILPGDDVTAQIQLLWVHALNDQWGSGLGTRLDTGPGLRRQWACKAQPPWAATWSWAALWTNRAKRFCTSN